MSAIIRPVLSRKALVFAILSSLIFLLALASASASSPVIQDPLESTSAPIADGIVQTPGEEAAPTPPCTSKATSERAGDIQATAKDSKNTSGSVPPGGGTGGASPAASHVTGTAALVPQQFPGYTAERVASYLKNHAQGR